MTRKAHEQSVIDNLIISSAETSQQKTAIVDAFVLSAGKYGDRRVSYSQLAQDLKVSYSEALTIVNKAKKKYKQEVHHEVVAEFAMDVVKDCLVDLEQQQRLRNELIQTFVSYIQQLWTMPASETQNEKAKLVIDFMSKLPALQEKETATIKEARELLTMIGKLTGADKSITAVVSQQQTTNIVTSADVMKAVDHAFRNKQAPLPIIDSGDNEEDSGETDD